jgi:hypothetical protein
MSIGKKERDHLRFLVTESGFENSFLDEDEIRINEVDVQT